MLTSRNAEFQGGMYGNQQPTGIAPTSVLIPYMKSAIANNAGSTEAMQRQTPMGLLPTQNGYAADTYSRKFTGVPTQVGY